MPVCHRSDAPVYIQPIHQSTEVHICTVGESAEAGVGASGSERIGGPWGVLVKAGGKNVGLTT